MHLDRPGRPLDAASPLVRRFAAWLEERFPPANMVMAALLWGAALAWGRFRASPEPVRFEAVDCLGVVAATSFFLMLRVLDEHKDYELDCRLHPDRVLQRGLVSLGHLKVVGGAAIAVQLGVSLLLDGGLGPITIAWIATFAWSLLMAREFFVGHWLKPRLVLYAASHMLVTPLAVHWLMRMGSRGEPLATDAALLPATSFLIGAAFEIARKLKAPKDERDGVDSYTRVLGVRGAAIALSVIVVLACGGFFAMSARLGGWASVASRIFLLGMALAVCGKARTFAAQPTPARVKSLEAAVGIVVVLSLALLVATVLLARGATSG